MSVCRLFACDKAKVELKRYTGRLSSFVLLLLASAGTCWDTGFLRSACVLYLSLQKIESAQFLHDPAVDDLISWMVSQ